MGIQAEAWLKPEAVQRGNEHVKRLSAQWDKLGPRFRRLLPNADVQTADLFWHLGIMELVESRADMCSYCNPERWDPDSDDPKQWPCASPLTPVVSRAEHKPAPEATVGRLEVSWLPCAIYREWAVQRKKRNETRAKARGAVRKA